MQYHLRWYCDTTVLVNSFDTNCILKDNKNKNLGQYDHNPIPSQIIPYYSFPASLLNQNEIPIVNEPIWH